MSTQQSSFEIAGLNWTQIRIPLVLVLLAAIPPLVFHEGATYVSRLFIMALIFATLAMALNIVFGHTDQLFLFMGALTGIGAYTTAITAESLGISPWATLLLGALLAGAIGALVCFVSAKLRFTVILISILTLALQFAIVEFFVGASDLTGGSTGMVFSGLAFESIQESLGIHEHVILYYLVLAILGATIVFYDWMRRSKFGIAFDAIRQDEVAAESVGVNVVRYKTVAGFVSAFIIGLIGPMYAQLEGLIIPGMFQFQVIDVLVLIILIVGGMRTLLGPIVGAGIIIYINEELQAAGQWRMVLFGALLIVLFLYFRQGIVPFARDLLHERIKITERLAREEQT
ncbi:branched-chain amino acid ABC transporter permease [Natrarchaeobaculum aegyptiacum]|uniref:Inner-membrane translocator n=1 Tax=Natrarchaeobaculum aegyptiacum TaxID=745377 RepID=A0A2Z2HUV8_9EURY|nr:branched-chain amino acid ABC transporter permease [Natrarchaeobaculum aegyptiacum]ARS91086.1 inner-membrane translocator [Natrarchaeobaculum aegyptiacum]